MDVSEKQIFILYATLIVVGLSLVSCLAYHDETRYTRDGVVYALCQRLGYYYGGFRNALGDEYCYKNSYIVGESPYVPFKDTAK